MGRLVYWRSDFYLWNGRSYSMLPEDVLEAWVSRFVREHTWKRRVGGEMKVTAGSPTRSMVRNVTGIVRDHWPLRPDPAPPLWLGKGEAQRTIVLHDCVLDVERFLAMAKDEEGVGDLTGVHTPDLFSVNELEFDWDPAASCPKWDAFLAEVLPEEAHRATMSEWFGYCLIPSQDYQAIMIFQGEGANGKSIIQSVLRRLVGVKNCSAVALDDLHRPHATSPLVGKLVNWAGEWGFIDKEAVSILKRISGGDSIMIDPKYKPRFEMRLPTRFCISTNEAPRLQDRSDAIWRRLLTVPFKVQIDPERQREPGELVDDLCSELPGILLWALGGLVELVKRGGFMEDAHMIELKEEYRAAANPEATFCDEHLAVDEECFAYTDDVFREYRDWCRRGEFKPMNREHFGRQMRRWWSKRPETAGAELGLSQPRAAGGGRRRRYEGVRLLMFEPGVAGMEGG